MALCSLALRFLLGRPFLSYLEQGCYEPRQDWMMTLYQRLLKTQTHKITTNKAKPNQNKPYLMVWGSSPIFLGAWGRKINIVKPAWTTSSQNKLRADGLLAKPLLISDLPTLRRCVLSHTFVCNSAMNILEGQSWALVQADMPSKAMKATS